MNPNTKDKQITNPLEQITNPLEQSLAADDVDLFLDTDFTDYTVAFQK